MNLRTLRAVGLAFVLTSCVATTAFAAVSTGEQKRLNDAASVVTALRGAENSWGFQAGAQEIDLVLLVMNRDAAVKMLNSKVSLGADASVAAGPVGRAASASTNENLSAQVLSYSRTHGVFAGINLSGGALKVDKDSNTDAYGRTVALDTVMAGNAAVLPAANTFVNTLGPSPAATTGTSAPAPTAR